MCRSPGLGPLTNWTQTFYLGLVQAWGGPGPGHLVSGLVRTRVCQVQDWTLDSLVVYFFPSMLFDDMVCNPHTASSILFPPCLTMWLATHTPHHLFLSLSIVFDDAVCNPHAMLSISFCYYFYTYSWILLEVY